MDLSPFVASSTPYLTAFLAGLFGGVHCIGMCGGITGALVFGLPAEVRGRYARLLPYLLAYNGGRIASYAAAGAIVGMLGYMAADMLSEYRSWIYLRVAAAVFMIALGLYLAGWWFGLARLEQAAGGLWARLQPLSRRLLPVRGPGQAVLLGLVWGWLPCGLVYSMLVYAFAAGGWREGALFMLSFGLGTLPTLLGAGAASAALGGVLQRPAVRRFAGAVVIAFGLWTLAATLIAQPNVGLGCAVPTP
jgi:sulfite exporter TauE/SafE